MRKDLSYRGWRDRRSLAGCLHTRALPLVGCLAWLLLLPAQSLAVDASIDLRDSIQQGQTAAGTYRQSTVQSDANASQLIPIGGLVNFRLDGRLLRQLFTSRTDTIRTSLNRTTQQAGTTVDFNRRLIRFSFNGGVYQQKTTGSGSDTPLFRRHE